MAQQIRHLLRGNLLGVEQVVDTHIDEHLLVVGLEVLIVVDTRDRLLGTELLGHNSREDIHILVVIDGNEQITTPNARLTQHGKGGGVAFDGDQIGHSLQLVERLHVAVDNRNIVAATAQHTRQVATHLSDS